jgi:hypothetical protein
MKLLALALLLTAAAHPIDRTVRGINDGNPGLGDSQNGHDTIDAGMPSLSDWQLHGWQIHNDEAHRQAADPLYGYIDKGGRHVKDLAP